MHALLLQPNTRSAYNQHVTQQPPTASPLESLTFSHGPTILQAPRTPTVIIWRTKRQRTLPKRVFAIWDNSHHLPNAIQIMCGMQTPSYQLHSMPDLARSFRATQSTHAASCSNSSTDPLLGDAEGDTCRPGFGLLGPCLLPLPPRCHDRRIQDINDWTVVG